MKTTSSTAIRISGILLIVSVAIKFFARIFSYTYLASTFDSVIEYNIFYLLRQAAAIIINLIPTILLIVYIFAFNKDRRGYFLVPVCFIFSALNILFSIFSEASGIAVIIQHGTIWNIFNNLYSFISNIINLAFTVFFIVVSFHRFESKASRITLYVFYTVSTLSSVAFVVFRTLKNMALTITSLSFTRLSAPNSFLYISDLVYVFGAIFAAVAICLFIRYADFSPAAEICDVQIQ